VTTILAHFSPNRHQNIELTDFCLGTSVEIKVCDVNQTQNHASPQNANSRNQFWDKMPFIRASKGKGKEEEAVRQ
jgi:hypothetical protein